MVILRVLLVTKNVEFKKESLKMISSETRSDQFLRLGRRGLVAVLSIWVVLGATLLAMALRPESVLAQWMSRAPWLAPVAIVVIVTALSTSYRRLGFAPDAPETRAVLQDEWRQACLGRAFRGAFFIVLGAQALFALLLARVPAARALWTMAGATICLGMAAFTALFLVFDRER